MLSKAALERVRAKLSAGETGTARRICASMLEKHPASPDWLQISGAVEMSAGNATRAVNFLRRATTAAPNAYGLSLLAYALLVLDKFDDAMLVCNSALSVPGLTTREAHEMTEMKNDISMVRRIASDYTSVTPTVGVRDTWEDSNRLALANFSPRSRLTAIFFHIDRDDKHPFLEGRVDYRSVLRGSLEAFRKSNPDAQAILLTDIVGDTSWLPEGISVARFDVDASQLMYSRMRCYRALIVSKAVSGPTLLLDTDVCVQRDFAPVFDGSFDLGLTYRTQPGNWHMPVNEGLIMLADGASCAAASFFSAALNVYEWMASQPWIKERYGFDVRNWRGGQLSLNAVIDRKTPPFSPDAAIVAGARVKYLPAESYNYSIKSTDDLKSLGTKFAIHFKGGQAKSFFS